MTPEEFALAVSELIVCDGCDPAEADLEHVLAEIRQAFRERGVAQTTLLAVGRRSGDPEVRRVVRDALGLPAGALE